MNCKCCKRECAGKVVFPMEGTIQVGFTTLVMNAITGFPASLFPFEGSTRGAMRSLSYRQQWDKFDSITDEYIGTVDGKSWSKDAQHIKRVFVGDAVNPTHTWYGYPMRQTVFATGEDDPDYVLEWEETGESPESTLEYYVVHRDYVVNSVTWQTADSTDTGPIEVWNTYIGLKTEASYVEGYKIAFFRSGSASFTMDDPFIVSMDGEGHDGAPFPDTWDCANAGLKTHASIITYDGGGEFTATTDIIAPGDAWGYAGYPTLGSPPDESEFTGTWKKEVDLVTLGICLSHCLRKDPPPTL